MILTGLHSTCFHCINELDQGVTYLVEGIQVCKNNGSSFIAYYYLMNYTRNLLLNKFYQVVILNGLGIALVGVI